jgi:prevent-host-death family protein
LFWLDFHYNLVRMTSSKKGEPSKARAAGRTGTKLVQGPVKSRARRPKKSGSWVLQDAKARFSELVRCAKLDGPQHVSVHGREEVVVISAEEFRRLKGELSGAALIEAMQASPSRDIELAPDRSTMPVRTLDL